MTTAVDVASLPGPTEAADGAENHEGRNGRDRELALPVQHVSFLPCETPVPEVFRLGYRTIIPRMGD
jgi:hypothetical protein